MTAFHRNGRRGVAVLVLPAAARCAPAVARSLAAAGFRVIGAHHGPLRTRSRHISHLVRYPLPSLDPAGFVEAVATGARRHDAVAVLPLGEPETRMLAEGLPRFEGPRLVGPTAAQYAALCDKVALPGAAERAGVDHPAWALVGAHGVEGQWPRLPSVVKLRAPGHPALAGVIRTHTTIVRTARERDAAVAELLSAFGEALVQEFLAGRHWRVHFVRGQQGLGMVSALTVRRYPLGTGPASVSRAQPGPPGLTGSIARLLDLVDYNGPGEVELIEHQARFFVHDVNLRPSASVGEAVRAGLDVPRLAVENALGLSPPLEAVGTSPLTYVSLPGEAAHLLDALARHTAEASAASIGRELVLAALSRKRILDPFTLTDPLPALGALVEGAGRRLTRTSGHRPWRGDVKRRGGRSGGRPPGRSTPS